MIVEMVGAIGAGKSTLVEPMQRWLDEQGFQALSPAEGMKRCLARSLPGRVSRRLLPRSLTNGIVQRVALRLARQLFLLRFIVAHPRLARLAVRAASQLDLPGWHRKIIRNLFLQVGAEYQFLQACLRRDEVVVFDEGFVHRAVNLFAWRERPLDPQLLYTYFAQLPVTDLVVLVEAPRDTCATRSRQRGLPRRLVDKDERFAARLLANSATIANLASGYLVTAQRPHLVVDNGRSLDETVTQLRAALDKSPCFTAPRPASTPQQRIVYDGR